MATPEPWKRMQAKLFDFQVTANAAVGGSITSHLMQERRFAFRQSIQYRDERLKAVAFA